MLWFRLQQTVRYASQRKPRPLTHLTFRCAATLPLSFVLLFPASSLLSPRLQPADPLFFRAQRLLKACSCMSACYFALPHRPDPPVPAALRCPPLFRSPAAAAALNFGQAHTSMRCALVWLRHTSANISS